MLRVAKHLGTTAVLHVVMLTTRLLMEIAVWTLLLLQLLLVVGSQQ
jgi:hypothetical protein